MIDRIEQLRRHCHLWYGVTGEVEDGRTIETPEQAGLVALWLEYSIRRVRGTSRLYLDASEPILLLQLSDLQFGGGTPDAAEAEKELTAQAIVTEFGKGPDFLALTGDVAEFGLPSDYESASKWLDGFQLACGMSRPPDTCLTIPGNHDLCRPLAWSARLDPIAGLASGLSERLVHSELLAFCLEPFRLFAEQLTHGGQWRHGTNYWVSGRYREYGLIFYGYNSCESLDSFGNPTRRFVDETLAEMFREVRAFLADAPTAVVVGMIHHPIASPTSNADNMTNVDVFAKHLAGVRSQTVVLCGHTHDNGEAKIRDAFNSRFIEVVAPPARKAAIARREDSLRGFTVLEFKRQDHTYSLECLPTISATPERDHTRVTQITSPGRARVSSVS